jgi:hypothetical protein
MKAILILLLIAFLYYSCSNGEGPPYPSRKIKDIVVDTAMVDTVKYPF